MNKFILSTAGISILLLSACTPPETSNGDETSSSSVSSAPKEDSNSSIPETQNVNYEGVVKPAGISIYMEGTHKLELVDGRFILLEGDGVDLNGYVNESVTVHGAIRPTVEGGGIIMRVERIELKEESSSSSEESSESSSEESSSSSEEPVEASSASSEAASSLAPVASSSAAAQSSSAVSSSEASAEFEGKVTLMAADDMSAANWSRQYCTSHIEFCIPVHKNWWYKSFGTTTTSLWHVELSSEEVENIGDGPIQILLLSGSASQDGQVVTSGSQSVGYKNWTDNRHFEVRGDARLEAAIRYVTEHLTALETTEE